MQAKKSRGRIIAGGDAFTISGGSFETILNCMEEAIVIKDERCKIVFANDAACEMVGIPREQIPGKTDYSLFPRRQANASRACDRRVLDTGTGTTGEEQVTDRHGKTRVIMTTRKLSTGKEGQRQIVIVMKDVTERKRAAEALRESEIKYRATVENSLAGVYLVQDNLFRFVNKRFCEIFGYAPEEVVDRVDPVDMICPEDKYISERHKEGWLHGTLTSWDSKIRCMRKDGTIITLLILVSPMIYNGRPALSGTILDITEQERSQEELRQKTAFLEAQMGASLDAIVVVNEDRILLQSGQFAELFEMPRGVARSKDANEQIEWIATQVKYPERFREDVAGVLADPFETMRDELELADGTMLERYTAPVVGKDGKCYGRIWMFRDITARKESEQMIRVGQRYLSEVMDLARIVYWEADPTQDLLVFNDVFYALYGTTAQQEGGYRMTREEYVRRFVHPDDLPAFFDSAEQSINGQERSFVVDLEHRIIRRDKEVRYILVRIMVEKDDAGNIVTLYGANQDITERKRAEEEKIHLEAQLLQAQKMEAMGVLASGIAHDFNNVLQGIIGFTEMIKEDTVDSRQHRKIELVLKGAHRGRGLVRQILAFCRETKPERKTVGLREIVEDGLQLIRPALPSTIRVRFTCFAEHDTISADAGQIHQILMNLCTNAAHAMEKTGGTLAILISDHAVTGEDLPFPQVIPGRYVTLSVHDTGCGMRPGVLERIFDPFFTTKRKGEGTGLGLSVVRSIVKTHGGHVTVTSKPGKGSVFTVYLPETKTAADPHETTVQPVTGGSERILFVDDEEMLVDLNGERLSRLGYDVVTTTSSTKALELFENEPHGFDLVISDYTMPHLTGLDLAERMWKTRPDIPIIICTGHNDNVLFESAKKTGVEEFLLKPQSRDDLARTIRKVLESRTTA